MKRLRICLLNTYYAPIIPGGAEVSVGELANELAKDHDVLVISANTTNKRVEETVGAVRVVRIPAMNIGHREHYPRNILGKIAWRVLNAISGLRARLIKKEILAFAPDIVHAHNLGLLSFHLAPWLKKQRIKCVHTARDYRPICVRLMIKNGSVCPSQCTSCRLRNSWIRRDFQSWDGNIGISSNIGNDFVRYGYYHPERLRIIHNSIIDLHQAAPTADARYDAGFMGSLGPSKGSDLFLEIAASLPQYAFCIATQSSQADIDRHCKQLPPNVTLLGRVKPIDFFSQIRICIMPSRLKEGFGRVAAEGLSASRPVLASNRGGLTDIVEHGKNGYLLDPDLPADWTKHLQLLLEDQNTYLRFSLAARSRYEAMFSAEQILAKHLNFYNHLLTAN